MRAAQKKQKQHPVWEQTSTGLGVEESQLLQGTDPSVPVNFKQPEALKDAWKRRVQHANPNWQSFEETAPNLVSRNVVVANKRTSIRLEQSMWDALEEICGRENKTMNQICTHIDKTMLCSSFTAAVRVYTLSYFRAAATEIGHAAVGHGTIHS